ncbi:hypothetical protein V8C44DRAFT_341237 [Trichoderma aethiopicum]
MRLINVKTHKLEEFLDDRAPAYAILSHTWAEDYEELSFRDVEDGNTDKPGIGSVKFRECCRQAAEDDLGYAWVDTCCIDKANLVELSEAINSMFRWYQRASICYAFLSDVPGDENPSEKGSKFQRSRWFQRGWTLQELLAPRKMRFYGTAPDGVPDWQLLGTKASLRKIIASITGIAHEYLWGIAGLDQASIAQRMSWAANRDTKRKEDLAYCLLGIFDITMPMIYGEGGEQAFFRLQEQIMKKRRDDSILAWGLQKNGRSDDESTVNDYSAATAGRILAKAPAEFAGSGHIVHREHSLTFTSSVDMSGGIIQAYMPLLWNPTGLVGLLSCGPEDNDDQVVGVPLISIPTAGLVEYARPRGYKPSLHSAAAYKSTSKMIRIRHESHESAVPNLSGIYFHYDDDEFAALNLRIAEVAPPSCWDKERALIVLTNRDDKGDLNQVLIRISLAEEPRDFVIILGSKEQKPDNKAGCRILICSRDTQLAELATAFPSMTRRLNGKTRARNGHLSLRVILEPFARQPIFVMRPQSVLDETFTTVDATGEMERRRDSMVLGSLRILDEYEAFESEAKKLNEWESHLSQKDRDIRAQLDEISSELRALEEKQKQLVQRQEENSVTQSNVAYRRSRVEQKQSGASTQWLKTQKRWNALRQVNYPFDELESTTRITWAAINGLVEVVEQCLDKGASVDAPDQHGWTPLRAASEGGHLKVVELLLRRGADVDAKDKDFGWTALKCAAANGHQDVVELLQGAKRSVDETHSQTSDAVGQP